MSQSRWGRLVPIVGSVAVALLAGAPDRAAGVEAAAAHAEPAAPAAPAAPEKCCKHATGICMGNDVAGKPICLYVVNAFNGELRYAQKDFTDDKEDAEKGFVKYVVDTPLLPTGAENHARFLQPITARVDDERLSTDGVVLLRAFCGGKDCAADVLKDTKLELNGKELRLSGDGMRVAAMAEPLADAHLGDALALRITPPNRATETRYSWYRPRNEWVVGYSVLGLAFAWPSWKMRGQPETAVVPAMMDVSYRWYKPNGRTFVFYSVGMGPNFVLAKAEENGDNKSGNKVVNGLVGAATVDVNGFKFGFGTRWNWLEGRFDPMIILSLTDAVARGLKLTDNAPAGLVNLSQ